MAIPIKRFNWVSFRPAWEQNNIWNAKRKAMREDFEAINSLALSSFANAQINLSEGLATLAAEAWIKRSQDAIVAKKAQVNKLV